MKHYILFSLFAISSLAMAEDLSVKHQANCRSSEARQLMGRDGSCRVVVAPKNLKDQGYCTGIFDNRLGCMISYLGDGSKNGLINLKCQTSNQTTVVDEDAYIDAVDYKVATLVTSRGKISVIEDPTTYRSLSNKTIEVHFAKESKEENPGSVILHFEDESVALTDVVCQ